MFCLLIPCRVIFLESYLLKTFLHPDNVRIASAHNQNLLVDLKPETAMRVSPLLKEEISKHHANL